VVVAIIAVALVVVYMGSNSCGRGGRWILGVLVGVMNSCGKLCSEIYHSYYIRLEKEFKRKKERKSE